MATNNSRGNAGYRLYLLGGILLFWCCAICLRLVYLQVFCYREFEQRGRVTLRDAGSWGSAVRHQGSSARNTVAPTNSA